MRVLQRSYSYLQEALIHNLNCEAWRPKRCLQPFVERGRADPSDQYKIAPERIAINVGNPIATPWHIVDHPLAQHGQHQVSASCKQPGTTECQPQMRSIQQQPILPSSMLRHGGRILKPKAAYYTLGVGGRVFWILLKVRYFTVLENAPLFMAYNGSYARYSYIIQGPMQVVCVKSSERSALFFVAQAGDLVLLDAGRRRLVVPGYIAACYSYK